MRPALCVQRHVPIEPVAPAIVEIIGREAPAMFLQGPAGGAPGLVRERHVRLLGRAAALLEIARRASSRDIFPRRPPALRARHDMIEGQVMFRAAILAFEAVAQEQVEARERRVGRRLHELAQRDHGGQLHGEARRMHLAFVLRDDIDTFEEHGLDRGLPRP